MWNGKDRVCFIKRDDQICWNVMTWAVFCCIQYSKVFVFVFLLIHSHWIDFQIHSHWIDGAKKMVSNCSVRWSCLQISLIMLFSTPKLFANTTISEMWRKAVAFMFSNCKILLALRNISQTMSQRHLKLSTATGVEARRECKTSWLTEINQVEGNKHRCLIKF